MNPLIPAVLEAGRKARDGQLNVSHTYKEDGSVLTRFDTELNAYLMDSIKQEYPDANIITEEMETDYRPGREYTFTIDPIDGTDSYSQGQPGWCVAVGLLDSTLKPVGGIVYAPRWGMSSAPETLVIAEQDSLVLVNGKPFTLDMSAQENPERTQSMINSRFHRDYGLPNYPGKIRYAGCAVLNALSVLLYPSVTAALISKVHIWDIAAAHGILQSAGLTMEYISGREINYESIVDRSPTEEYILAGSNQSIETIKSFMEPVQFG